VTTLPRQSGTKETRYAHLLGESLPVAPENSPVPGHARVPVEEFYSNDRVETLAAEVAELREQMTDLHKQFAAFRKQFE
jgi:uncharacterized protein YceH (UPF0502 family)